MQELKVRAKNKSNIFFLYGKQTKGEKKLKQTVH